MLEYLKESIEIAFKYKGMFDKEFEDTIIGCICSDITKEYILLIPNEKNYRDAELISNIDRSCISIECKKAEHQVSSLFNLIDNFNTAEDVYNYIRENFIIVRQKKEVLDEFSTNAKILDQLSGVEKRHLTRRFQMFDSKDSFYFYNDINCYWHLTTIDDEFVIDKVTYNSVFVSLTIRSEQDIEFPDRSIHENEPLNQLDFYNDCKKKFHLSRRRNVLTQNSLSCMYKQTSIYLTAHDAMKYFKSKLIPDFADKSHIIMTGVTGANENKILFNVRISFQPRVLINNLITKYV